MPPTSTRADEGPDDFGDDRPRRPSRKPAKRRGGVLKWVLAALGAFALVCLAACGGGAYLLGAFDPSPPAGYDTARSYRGGYRVWLPAPASRTKVGGQNSRDLVGHGHGVGPGPGTSAYVHSEKTTGGVGNGLDPASLRVAFENSSDAVHCSAPWYTKPVCKPTTLGGQAALEVQIGYNVDWMQADRGGDEALPPLPEPKPEPDADNPFKPAGDEFGREVREKMAAAGRRMAEQQRQDAEQRRKFRDEFDAATRQVAEQQRATADIHVFLVTVRGGRTYVLNFERQGEAPDETIIETVRASFQFQ